MKYLPLIIPLLVVLSCAIPNTETKDSPKKLAQIDHRPKMKYSQPTWENASNVNLLVHFEVQNISDRTLEYVKIQASFYDKDDNFVTSASPYIERWQGLPPNQRSAATVQTAYDRRIKNVKLTFTSKGEDALQEIDLNAYQVGKIE